MSELPDDFGAATMEELGYDKPARTDLKEGVLAMLKKEWKKPVVKQYQENPSLVRDADISKNAQGIYDNGVVNRTCVMVGITLEDIEKTLTEIRSEVIRGV